MRILLVNKYAKVTGGADTQCLLLAARLRERGHEVAFLSTSDLANEETSGAFVPRSVTSATKQSLDLRSQMATALIAQWNHTAYRAMVRLIRSFSPDVVSAHKLYPQLSVSPLAAARKLGVPIVQTVQDYEFVSADPLDASGSWHDGRATRLRFGLLNSSLLLTKRVLHRRLVTRWTTVSRYVARILADHGITAEVVPNIAPACQASAVEMEQRDGIAFAGRLSEEKGIGDLVQLGRLLPGIRLRVAGDGSERTLIESAARELPNLEYLGPLQPKQVLALFARSRVVVVPSLWEEPGALVTLEAMSTGTPLVVYRAGGIAEYVTDSGSGSVIDRRPAILADTCERIYRDPAEWKRYSLAARDAAANRYSADAHCERLEPIFRSAISP